MKKIAILCSLILLMSGCSMGEQFDKEMKPENIIRQQEFIDYTEEKNQEKLLDQWREGGEMLIKHSEYSLFYRDYWKFANNVFQEIASENDENLIYSPLSAYLPLAELSYALEKDALPQKDLVNLLRANTGDQYWTSLLMEQFQGDGYLMASSIWLSKETNPNIDFLKENLVSDIYQVNFNDKKAVAQQMNWINKWTKGFLKDQVKAGDFRVSDSSDSNKAAGKLACRLIGTTYVKSNWLDEFFSQSGKDIFYGENGKEQKIPFLKSQEIETEYWQDHQVEVVVIPLKNGSQFTIYLPKENQDINQLLAEGLLRKVENLEADGWERVKAYIEMPEFTQSSRIEILPVLEKMGYINLSEYHVGYNNLVGTQNNEDIPCRISQVLQESKIEVNKEGIEAAAYTKVDVDEAAMEVNQEIKRIKLKVNRPYIYVVSSHGLPSFIGINRNFEK